MVLELLDGVMHHPRVRHYHGGDDDWWHPRYHGLRSEIEVPQPLQSCHRNVASHRLRHRCKGRKRLQAGMVEVDERRW